MRREVRRVKRLFRILRGFRIDCRPAGGYRACVRIYDDRRRAILYGYGKRAPSDYVLHEVLHCALVELHRMDKRRPKYLAAAEEELVQDICYLFKRKRK